MNARNDLWGICAALALSVLAWACDPDALNRPQGSLAETPVEGLVELPLRIGAAPEGTKASVLDGVEAVGSGALVLVYRTASGQLDSYRFFTQEELDAQDSSPLRIQAPLTECDFYILGNLNAIGKSSGDPVHLLDALGDAFPADEGQLEDFLYRLDGGDLHAGYRRETFSEVARYGIPYAHISKGVDVVRQAEAGEGIPGAENCKRLFSKVTVRIDHSRLDGSGSNPQAFVNRKLYLRQANGRLQPFSDAGQKAQEAQDILTESDFDPDMAASNASVAVYSFYVPENLQGTLLPTNTDNREKIPEMLVGSGHAAAVPYLTYVEFAGRLDPAQGGYGGDVTYRFYLGADNCTNFDLERGREYQIHLTFRAGSLFHPDWSVGVEGWTDQRLFCLTADAAYQTRLPDNQQVVVRKNRAGAFYLYANPSGEMGADNALAGCPFVLPDAQDAFSPAGIMEYAFTGAFFASGTDESAWLATRGISPDYDSRSGRLTLTVTDAASFNAHIGEEGTFSVRLLPGGEWRYFVIRLADDIVASISGGAMYLGQKMSANVTGMTGDVYYYGNGANWNNTPTLGAVDGGWRSGSTVNLYGTGEGSAAVTFASTDAFNNDPVTLQFAVYKPALKAARSSVWLPFDGDEQDVGVGYYTADGATLMPPDWFDGDCWNNFMRPAISCQGKPELRDCIGVDYSSGRMWLAKTTWSGGNVEDLDYGIVGGPGSGRPTIRESGFSLGYIYVYNPALPSLYPENSAGCRISGKLTRPALGDVRSLSGWHGSTLRSDGTFGVGYYYEPSGWSGDQPHDQLTDSFAFGVSIPYAYPNADAGNISWSRAGNAKTWTSSHGESFGPVISCRVDEADSGSGGRIVWEYKEVDQVVADSRGEPVPGGLLVPYGDQTVTATVRNKHDGRSCSVSSVFRPTYEVISCSYFVTARSGAATAKVYPLPRKVIKYLYAMGSSLTRSQRQEMIKLFDQGTGYWPMLQNVDLYRTSSYSSDYSVIGYSSSFPLSNFSASYLSRYKYGNSSYTTWTTSMMEVLKTCPYTQIKSGVELKTIANTTTVSISGFTGSYNQGVIFNGEYL